MTKIKTIKDQNNNVVVPLTHIDAVVNDSNVTIGTLLSDQNDKITEVKTKTDIITLDGDGELFLADDGTYKGAQGGSIYEHLIIQLTSNQAQPDNGLIGATVKVTSDAETLLDTTWDGNDIQLAIVAATQYTITVGDVEGYAISEKTKTNIAGLGTTVTAKFSYNTCVLTVNLDSDQTDKTAIANATATVKYGSVSKVVNSGDSVKVPYGATTTVTASDVTYYYNPGATSVDTNASNKSITITYQYVTLTVNIASNQASDSTIAATKATVAYGSTSTSVSTGSTIPLPPNTSITVTFPAVSGYSTPSAVTYTTNSSNLKKTVSGQYNTTILTVTITDNQSSYNDISSAKATVTATGMSSTTLSSGGTVKVPTGVTNCKITWSSVSGYKSPDTLSGFTVSGTTLSKSGTYSTEILTVNVTSDGAAPSGYTTTVKTSSGTTLGSQTSSSKTYKIPSGTQYYVTTSEIAGFNTPSNSSTVTAASSSNASRTITMTYEEIKNGIFIATSAGGLVPYADWTSSSGTPVGVAVRTDNSSYIIGLKASQKTSIAWSSNTSTDLSAVPTSTDSSTIATYYDGVAYTDAMIAAGSAYNTTSYAAGYARSKSISFGGTTLTGYLGSAGEWQDALNNHQAIMDAFTKIGETFVSSYYYFWASCEYSSNYAWSARWLEYGSYWYLGSYDKSLSSSYPCVVPFYKI